MVFSLIALLLSHHLLPAVRVCIAIISCLFRVRAFVKLGSVFTMYKHTISRLDGFAMGGLIAYLWRKPAFDLWLTNRAQVLRRWLIFLVLGIPVLAVAVAYNIAGNMAIWGHTFLTLFYGAALVFILRSVGSPRLAWLRNRNLMKMGPSKEMGRRVRQRSAHQRIDRCSGVLRSQGLQAEPALCRRVRQPPFR